jgi:Mg/Co/Ni transporter MgtE
MQNGLLNPEELQKFRESLTPERMSEIISNMTPEQLSSFIATMPSGHIVEFLGTLLPDQRALFVTIMTLEQRAEVSAFIDQKTSNLNTEIDAKKLEADKQREVADKIGQTQAAIEHKYGRK